MEEPFSWKNALRPMHLIVIATAFIVDQVTKYMIIWWVPLGTDIAITPFLNITHTKNKGAAFGIFHDASPTFRLVFFGLVTIVALWYFIYFLGKMAEREKWTRFALALLLGGALGNVKDRLIFQQVTDFIDVHYAGYHWPSFNIADSAISVGAVLLFVIWATPTLQHWRVKLLGGTK